MRRAKTATEIKRANQPSEFSTAPPSSCATNTPSLIHSIRRGNSSLRSRPGTSLNEMNLSSTYLSPEENKDLHTFDKGYFKSNLAVAGGYLLRYQPPLISARKPKNLNGPFDIYDVPDIRDAVKRIRRKETYRKNTNELNQQFYNDLEFDAYFSKKSNWLNDSKFNNTSSFYSAVKCYLPVVKSKHMNMLSTKYIELKKNRRNNDDQKKVF